MRLVTFERGGIQAPGVVQGDRVVQLPGTTLRDVLAHGVPQDVEDGAPTYAVSEVSLRAPLVPKKLLHTAGNFREHAEEGKRAGWVAPIHPWISFYQNVDAIVGPGADIIYPDHLTSELDYELELAVVIGRDGKHFGVEDAPSYIAGFTIFNDITARDIQRQEMESRVFSFCKSIDTFCPIGPWVVTADEIANPHALKMELRVNGEVRQSSFTGNMAVSIPQIVAHYSPLGYSAGDIVTTGTVSGVASFKDNAGSWLLKPGDVIEAEIEGIGILRNRVVSWADAYGPGGRA